MAWTDSRWFAGAVADMLDGTTAIDLDTDTLKGALFNNDVTPDRTAASASTAYNSGTWLVADEVDDGTEWDAAGEPLTSVDLTRTGGVITLDAADLPSGGSSATLADVYGVLVYSDTIASPVADQGVCFNYLGGANSVVNGSFTVQWGASGVATLTV